MTITEKGRIPNGRRSPMRTSMKSGSTGSGPSAGSPARIGYQNVNGRLYYLAPNSDILWVSRNVPNERWADASGTVQ